MLGLELCLAPILAAGLAASIPSITGDTGTQGGSIIGVSTCQEGIGAFAKVMPTDSLYMGGIQYGLTQEYKGFTFNLTPQAGVSPVLALGITPNLITDWAQYEKTLS